MPYEADEMTKAAFDWWNENPEAEWDNYIGRFVLKTKAQRVGVLQAVDQWLQDPKPTKETASRWTKVRQLQNLHWRLDRLGR